MNPHQSIPAFIAVLTGITDSMVATAPAIEQVLPQFLEFAQGCVLVAHNAPFDVGFLKHFAAEQGRPWPAFEVLDTARLARRVITRDDAPNCKLGSLATLFGAATTPNHRALSDARATVDVMHGLFARLGGLGVHTLEELQTFSSRVSQAQRKKRHLAEALPHAPGVYLFRDERDRVLYVGTSKDLRTRVRTYFTASETRSRMGEMVGLAESVTGIECATPLEAEVRELRLIAEHKPKYNRRSRFPERAHWVKVTVEPWPRLSMVRQVSDDGAEYLGPFGSKKVAERAVAALHETFPVRQCGGRMAKQPSQSSVRARGDGQVPLSVRRQRRARRRTPAWSIDLRGTFVAAPDAGDRGAVLADEHAGRRTSGSRRQAPSGTAWPPSSARPHGPSGSGRSPAAPSSSPPVGTTTAGGRCTWSATGGWPQPGSSRPARTPASGSRSCAPRPRR